MISGGNEVTVAPTTSPNSVALFRLSRLSSAFVRSVVGPGGVPLLIVDVILISSADSLRRPGGCGSGSAAVQLMSSGSADRKPARPYLHLRHVAGSNVTTRLWGGHYTSGGQSRGKHGALPGIPGIIEDLERSLGHKSQLQLYHGI